MRWTWPPCWAADKHGPAPPPDPPARPWSPGRRYRGGVTGTASPGRRHPASSRPWSRPAVVRRPAGSRARAAVAARTRGPATGQVSHSVLCVTLWTACAERQSGCVQEENSGDYARADSRKRDVNRQTIVHTLWRRQNENCPGTTPLHLVSNPKVYQKYIRLLPEFRTVKASCSPTQNSRAVSRGRVSANWRRVRTGNGRSALIPS
jgi:hypothetical protein